MSHLLRVFLFGLIFTFVLAGCGRTIQEEAPEAVNEATEDEENSETSLEEEETEFGHLTDLANELRLAEGQAGVDQVIQQARVDGYSDLDIASALGITYFWAPRKRVLMSVTFVRFKSGSVEQASELDEAFDYASTAPWVRRAEAEEAAELAAEEAALESLPESAPDNPVSITIGDDTADIEPSEDEAEESEEEVEGDEEQPSRVRRWFGWIPGI